MNFLLCYTLMLVIMCVWQTVKNQSFCMKQAYIKIVFQMGSNRITNFDLRLLLLLHAMIMFLFCYDYYEM